MVGEINSFIAQARVSQTTVCKTYWQKGHVSCEELLAQMYI